MTTVETKEQQIARLTERHVRDRNMDPSSIKELYTLTHLGIELDPDFFEARLDMGWGFFRDEPRHLDHITRNMLIFVYLAYRRSVGCFHQGKKAVMMGASYEQMVEALEAAHAAGGGLTLHHGFGALQRMRDEGLEPGSQEGPGQNNWVTFDYGQSETSELNPEVPVPANLEETETAIRAYYSEEFGGAELAEDLVFAARMDPEFWSRYARLAWGVYREKRCFLDPVRRELMILVIVAFQGRPELTEFHMRRALKLGATPEAVLEGVEVTFVGAGNRTMFDAIRVLRKIVSDE